MSFWDNVKKFTQPYADDEYDEYEDGEGYDEEETADESASRFRRGGDSAAAGDTDPFSGSTAAPAGTSGAFAAAPSGSTVSGGFSGQVVGGSYGKSQVVISRPVTFDDSSKVANELRNKKAVIVNMENVDKAMVRRVVDFLTGCVYALDGRATRVANSTYLFTPYNVEVSGEMMESLQSEVDSYV